MLIPLESWLKSFQQCVAQPPLTVELPAIAIANPPFETVHGSDYPAFELAHKWRKQKTDDEAKASFEKLEKFEPRVALEGLFLERMLTSLPLNSAIVALLPNGILSNAGDEYVRNWLLKNFQLLASLQMPTQMWSIENNLTLGTSVLVVAKQNARPLDHEILMGMAQTCGFTTRGNPFFRPEPEGWEILNDEIPELFATFAEFIGGADADATEPLEDGLTPEYRLQQMEAFVHDLERQAQRFLKSSQVWNPHYKRFLTLKPNKSKAQLRRDRIQQVKTQASRYAAAHDLEIEFSEPWVLTPMSKLYCDLPPVAIGETVLYQGAPVQVLGFRLNNAIENDFRSKVSIQHPQLHHVCVWATDLTPQPTRSPAEMRLHLNRLCRAFLRGDNALEYYSEIENQYWSLLVLKREFPSCIGSVSTESIDRPNSASGSGRSCGLA